LKNTSSLRLGSIRAGSTEVDLTQKGKLKKSMLSKQTEFKRGNASNNKISGEGVDRRKRKKSRPDLNGPIKTNL